MQRNRHRNAAKIKAAPIAHEGIRSALAEPQLHKLEAASQLRRLRGGERLFCEGDKVTHSFIVLSGTVKLTKTHPDGDPRVIGLLFAGDLLCGACGPLRTYSAEAGTDLELCAIPVEVTSRLAEEAPLLERVLFQAALAQLEARHDWMLLLRGASAFQRVAGFFRLLARQASPRQCGQAGERCRTCPAYLAPFARGNRKLP